MNAINLFEANIIYWIQENLRADVLTPIMKVITTLGNAGIFWIVLSVLLLIFKKTRKIGICCALALIFDLLIVNITIKPLVARIRPYDVMSDIVMLVSRPGDFSFPSGHSAASFACAWAMFRTAKRSWGVPAMILAALIALSRLYVGVHYPTDVIFGAAIGMLAGELGARIGKPIWRNIRRSMKKKGKA